MKCKTCALTLLVVFLAGVTGASVPIIGGWPDSTRGLVVGQTSGDGKSASVWTCWYEGARIHRLPILAREMAVGEVRVGQTFAADVIEENPLGHEWLRVRRPSGRGWLWIPLPYCRRVAPENVAQGNLPIGSECVSLYDGLPPDYRPTDMVRLAHRYCYNDLPQLLREEAAAACRDMLDAARREAGLSIKVLSAYRSARTQAYLCRRKLLAEGIDQRTVAQPGHSEHQLGTTVDLVGADGRFLLDERFASTREGRWLTANCRRFGFVQSYSRTRAVRRGFAYEPWHFRYVGCQNVEQFESD